MSKRKIKRRDKKRTIKRRKPTTKDNVRQVTRRKKRINKRVEFISSGCITLNLALSGLGKAGGWARARVNNIVGDGSSGKTLLALELCFWFWKFIRFVKSKIFPKVKKVIICYDNGEGVMDFPVEKMYGQEFYDAVNWERSKNFEQFCRRFLRKAFSLKKGEALLYVIDSWDSFQSAKSKKAFMESIKDDTELKGDYDLALQKYASRKFFPTFCDILEENKIDATLIIISQVRSKIGVTFGKKQTRTGGKALDFYTHMVAWVKEIKKLDKTKKGHKRIYGIRSEAMVERSKVAKPFRSAEFTILYDYGIDDISSMMDFLWPKGTIKFNGKKFKTKNSFIKYVEKENLEDELIKKTEEKWYEIEASFEDEVKRRKPRH